MAKGVHKSLNDSNYIQLIFCLWKDSNCDEQKKTNNDIIISK